MVLGKKVAISIRKRRAENPLPVILFLAFLTISV